LDDSFVNRDGPRGLVWHGIVRSEAGSGKTTTFVASTDRADRARDIVAQDWVLDRFLANPVILDNHDSRRVVGMATRAAVEDGRLVIEVAWDLESPDPSIAAVGHQHLQGFRRAGSVGFRAGKVTFRADLPDTHPAYGERGYFYEGNELLEFSSATIPMNPDALQRPKSVVSARNADGLDFLFLSEVTP
jgi:hypothetical protein